MKSRLLLLITVLLAPLAGLYAAGVLAPHSREVDQMMDHMPVDGEANRRQENNAQNLNAPHIVPFHPC